MENPQMSFEDAQFALQQSWEVHRQAFGPILEPAFAENQQVRIPLINALNHISRREIQRGLELLKEIRQYCVYEEDLAAWTFFVGLCFEMVGAQKQMLKWYEDAAKYNHRFYLPYLKIAKAAHQEGQLEKAKGYYALAIACLLEMPEKDRDEVILGSAYTNLVSCLTVLHQYPEAEKAWKEARKYPQQPGALASAAILYAAMGDVVRTGIYLQALAQKLPEQAAQVQIVTAQILNGEHPQFPGETG